MTTENSTPLAGNAGGGFFLTKIALKGIIIRRYDDCSISVVPACRDQIFKNEKQSLKDGRHKMIVLGKVINV